MAESERFDFVNTSNFRVSIDKLPAFQTYLELAVDTILGIKPQREHVSQFSIDNSYKKPLPPNFSPDEEGEGYWKNEAIHYWLETSETPLVICTLGSGQGLIDPQKIDKGRQTFANQKDLVKRVMELTSTKDFIKDVLPHIPYDHLRGNDINEELLRKVIDDPTTYDFETDPKTESLQKTGKDLRGVEEIGYIIIQKFDPNEIPENTLEIGLCKAYYPR